MFFFIDIRPAGWTDWSWWKTCSKSCGGGKKSRYRKCNNPPPLSGGRNCSGNYSQEEECNTHDCPGNQLAFSTQIRPCVPGCSTAIPNIIFNLHFASYQSKGN